VGNRYWLLISFFGLLLVWPGKIALAQTASQDPVLAVLVYNFSEASPELIDRAERETQRIFGQAKIHVSWIDCPIRKVPTARSACYEEPLPGQIRLRILKHPSEHSFRNSIFGFAIAPLFATVYYESAERLTRISRNAEIDLSVVLGCLIAHEIGHLLLGENRHSASGIMKAQWELKQLQLAMMGSLLFLPEERALLTANARERSNKSSEMFSASSQSSAFSAQNPVATPNSGKW